MESGRELRQNPWRYVLLANVVALTIAFTFTAVAAAGTLLGMTAEPRDAGQWLIAVAIFWSALAGPFSLGYFLERRMAWWVGPAGITVFNADGRQVAFLAWAEVAWVRVFPLGAVFVAARSRKAPLWGLFGVPCQHAKWLRQFASEQLRYEDAGGLT